jgi:uncharacterized protein
MKDCPDVRPVELFIVQASPFCNIDCKYCYLSDRLSSRRLSLKVLEKAVSDLVKEDLLPEVFSVVWHAGEPLTVPIRYYEEAFALIRALVPERIKVVHNFQSNGTLINQSWCEFFSRNETSIGLSIDGPDWIHNANRVSRSGRGTHALAMKAVSLLREYSIDFHIICVITATSLRSPKSIVEFFRDLGIRRVGFNVEEVEGIHVRSSIAERTSIERENFFRELFILFRQLAPDILVREFESAYNAIRFGMAEDYNMQTTPYSIFSLAWDGGFSTFSPEMLGIAHERYGDFIFGNIETCTPLEAIRTEKFQKIYKDILKGVRKCRKDCSYFNFCGGGAPSNKLFENEDLASTRTMYCEWNNIFPTNIVLEALEQIDLRLISKTFG